MLEKMPSTIKNLPPVPMPEKLPPAPLKLTPEEVEEAKMLRQSRMSEQSIRDIFIKRHQLESGKTELKSETEMKFKEMQEKDRDLSEKRLQEIRERLQGGGHA